MIITRKIKIKTTNKNISHYINMGYNIKSGDEIIIPVGHLPLTSKLKVKVKCDVCGVENEIIYFSYLRNIKNYGYYGCKKCSIEKSKKTNILVYGVEYAMQNLDVRKKTIETNRERYGCDTPLQNEDVKNKIVETNLKNHGVKCFLQTDEARRKMKDNYEKNKDDIQNKRELTNMNKYGYKTPLQSDEIKEKIKKIKKDKYDDENYNNRDLYKQTCMGVFGFENPMQNGDTKDKLKNILIDKYGVDVPAQNIDIFEKMLKSGYRIKKYKSTDLYYQGTYELDFLNKYYDIGIKKAEPVKYIIDNKKHVYFPDFYYEPLNLIIEIESTRWYVENLDKNLAKQKACIEQGYNFIFIIDKNYEIFDKMITYIKYDKDHCWQYDIRLNNLENDIKMVNIDKKLTVGDFCFEYVDASDKKRCNEIKKFIEKYEWLGKMPNRPTHRFIFTYNNIIGGGIVMATPNAFSKLIGENTMNVEKLISRGACASWTPKNLASSLIMKSINWMVKNTEFRLFSAYSDTEAKELGTIYQACNFYYIGQKSGANKTYFDLNNPDIGWTTSRTFRKRGFFKNCAIKLGIDWQKNWSNNTRMLWDNIPDDISTLLRSESDKYIKNCIIRKSIPKHKYVYILGSDKKETKKLRSIFLDKNKIYKYPKKIDK